MGPALQLEEEPIKDIAQHAEDARKNFDYGKNFHKKHYHIKGVDDVIEIYSNSDSDYDEDGDYTQEWTKEKTLTVDMTDPK